MQVRRRSPEEQREGRQHTSDDDAEAETRKGAGKLRVSRGGPAQSKRPELHGLRTIRGGESKRGARGKCSKEQRQQDARCFEPEPPDQSHNTGLETCG